jgi:GH24 family phage-related lysozyme (muramidase)
MRHITQEGLDLIKHHEGYSSQIYICPAGYPTIGYGHLILSHEDFSNGITKKQAEDILRQDVQIAERAVLRLITVPLTDNQFNALVSFTFNLGGGALQRSTLRRVINRGDHAGVPQQFMRWVWANGQKLRGLIRRRGDEAILYQN